MARKPTNVIFSYSEQMLKEENTVLNPIGKQFIPGEIFIGTSSKKYTKMVSEEEYPGYVKKYPDSKIIYKGDRLKVKYTIPTIAMAIVREG